MPAVLVHGVPDGAWMWDPLRAHLARRDVVALELPGFGTPVPDGFGATKEDYADWLTEQLRAFDEPVDLVGHDWGGLLVQRVASTNPALVRTLACGSGPADRSYQWHAMAQLWQTPGVGEEVIAGMLGLPTADFVAGAVSAGTPADLAARQAAHLDELMGRCILALYRSAVAVGDAWEDGVADMERRPSLVLWGRNDPYVPTEFAERLARRIDDELIIFDGCEHWWPWARAREAAGALEQLWASAP